MSDEHADEREENQRVTRDRAAIDAAALLRTRPHGVLSTLSAKHDGWPFASVAPYALTRTGEPILYIASIAQHTRNLRADPRCALIVHPEPPPGQDVQTQARLTLMSTAEPIEGEAKADAWARYRARLPEARGYQRTHDFSLWRLVPSRARYIGGFGEIFWLKAEDFAVDPAQDILHDAAQGIVEHMNEDHKDALETYCKAFYGTSPSDVEMVGVDRFGFDVVTTGPDDHLRFDFARPAEPDTVRPLVIELLQEARARLAG